MAEDRVRPLEGGELKEIRDALEVVMGKRHAYEVEEGESAKELSGGLYNPVERLEFAFRVARELKDRDMSLDELGEFYEDYATDDLYEGKEGQPDSEELKKTWKQEKDELMRVPKLLSDLSQDRGIREILEKIPDKMKIVVHRNGKVDLGFLSGGLLKETLEGSGPEGKKIDLADALIASRLEKVGFGRAHTELEKQWKSLNDIQRGDVDRLYEVLKMAGININELKERRLKSNNKEYFLINAGKKTGKSRSIELRENQSKKGRKLLLQALCSSDDQYKWEDFFEDGVVAEEEWNKLSDDESNQAEGVLEMLQNLRSMADKLEISPDKAISRFQVWGDKKESEESDYVIWDYGDLAMKKGGWLKRQKLRDLIDLRFRQKKGMIADVWMEEMVRKNPARLFKFNTEGEAVGVTIESLPIGMNEYEELRAALEENETWEKWRAVAMLSGLAEVWEAYGYEKWREAMLLDKAGEYFSTLGGAEEIAAMLEEIPDFARVKAWQDFQGFVESGSQKEIKFGVQWDKGTKKVIAENKKWELASRFAIDVETGKKANIEDYEMIVGRERIEISKDREVEALVLRRMNWEDLTDKQRIAFGKENPADKSEVVLKDKWDVLIANERLVYGNNGVFKVGDIGDVKEALYARAEHEGVYLGRKMVDLAAQSHMIEMTGAWKGRSFDKATMPAEALGLVDIAGSGRLADFNDFIEAELDDDDFFEGRHKAGEAIKEGETINNQLTDKGQKKFEAWYSERNVLQTGAMSVWGVVERILDDNPINNLMMFRMIWKDRSPIFSAKKGKMNEERKRRGHYWWMGVFWGMKKGGDVGDKLGKRGGGPQPLDFRSKRQRKELLGFLHDDEIAGEILKEAGLEDKEIKQLGDNEIDDLFNNFFVELLDKFNERMGFSLKVGEMDFGVVKEESKGLVKSLINQIKGTPPGSKKQQSAQKMLGLVGLTREESERLLASDDESEIDRILDKAMEKWQKIVRLEKALEDKRLWSLDFSFVEKDGKTLNNRLRKIANKMRGFLDQLIYKALYIYRTYGTMVKHFDEQRTAVKPSSPGETFADFGPVFLDQAGQNVRGVPQAAFIHFASIRYTEYLELKIESREITSIPDLIGQIKKERVWEHYFDLYSHDKDNWALVNVKDWQENSKTLGKHEIDKLVWKLTMKKIMDYREQALGLGDVYGLFHPQGREQLLVHAVRDPYAEGDEKFLREGDWGYEKARNYWENSLYTGASSIEDAQMIELAKTVAEYGEKFKTELIKKYFSGYMKPVIEALWWGALDNHIPLPTVFRGVHESLSKMTKDSWRLQADGRFHVPWFLEEWGKSYWGAIDFNEGVASRHQVKVDITRNTPEAQAARDFLKELLFEVDAGNNLISDSKGRSRFKEQGFQFLIAMTFMMKVGEGGQLEEQMRKAYFQDSAMAGTYFRRFLAPVLNHGSDQEIAEGFGEWFEEMASRGGIKKVLENHQRSDLGDYKKVIRVMKYKIDQDPFWSNEEGMYLGHIQSRYGFNKPVDDSDFSMIGELCGYAAVMGVQGESLFERAKAEGRFDAVNHLRLMLWETIKDEEKIEEYSGDALEAFDKFIGNQPLNADNLMELKKFMTDNMGLNWPPGLAGGFKRWTNGFGVSFKETFKGVPAGATFGEKVKNIGTIALRLIPFTKPYKAVRNQAKNARKYGTRFTNLNDLVNKLRNRLPENRIAQLWLYSEFGLITEKLESTDLDEAREKIEIALSEFDDWEGYKSGILEKEAREELFGKLGAFIGHLTKARFNFSWSTDKFGKFSSPLFNFAGDHLMKKYNSVIDYAMRGEGFWYRLKRLSQLARYEDITTLEVGPDPHLTKKEKVEIFMREKKKLPAETLTEELLYKLGEKLFGTWKRPQEYLTNLMLSWEYNTLPIVSLLPKAVFGLLKTFNINVGQPDLDWVAKYLDPPLATLWLSGTTAALGLAFPSVATGLINTSLGWIVGPAFLTTAAPILPLVGVGIGLVATFGVGLGIYKHFQNNIFNKKRPVASGLIGAGVGIGTGTAVGGLLFLAGTAATPVIPALVAWWGVNGLLKLGMRGLNKGLAAAGLIKDLPRDVFLALRRG